VIKVDQMVTAMLDEDDQFMQSQKLVIVSVMKHSLTQVH